jgi:hypothetical protein
LIVLTYPNILLTYPMRLIEWPHLPVCVTDKPHTLHFSTSFHHNNEMQAGYYTVCNEVFH